MDIVVASLGKAFGGGNGGFICASKPVIELLRQKHRQYSFSNTVGIVSVAIATEALKMV